MIRQSTNEVMTFFGVVVLGVVAFVVIAGISMPTRATSPFDKESQCRISLRNIRHALITTRKDRPNTTFREMRTEWRRGGNPKTLAVDVCECCRAIAKERCGVVLKTRRIGGVDVLVDPWGNPYNVDELDNFIEEGLRDGLAYYSVDGVVVWSSGPNGINEHGDGDDRFELPASRMRTYAFNGNATTK